MRGYKERARRCQWRCYLGANVGKNFWIKPEGSKGDDKDEYQPGGAGPASVQKEHLALWYPFPPFDTGGRVGYYDATECFGKATSFDKHEVLSFGPVAILATRCQVSGKYR